MTSDDVERTDIGFGAYVHGVFTVLNQNAWRDRDDPSTLLAMVLLPPFLIGVPAACQRSAVALSDELALLDRSELAALRAMLAWNISMDSAHTTPLTEAQQRLATLDVEQTTSVAWKTFRATYDQTWRIAGEAYPDDATIIVIPTWQYGLRATVLDANTLFVLLHALIAEDDQETLSVIIDHAQVRRLLGLATLHEPSIAGASDAEPPATPAQATPFRPRWVTTPFGWIRLPPPQEE